MCLFQLENKLFRIFIESNFEENKMTFDEQLNKDKPLLKEKGV